MVSNAGAIVMVRATGNVGLTPGVDHHEIEAAVEALPTIAGYRRTNPDLPGMGRSTTGGLGCNYHVVKLLPSLSSTCRLDLCCSLGIPTERTWGGERRPDDWI